MEEKQVVVVIDFGTTNTGCLVEYYNKKQIAEGFLINRNPFKYGDYAKQPTFLLINKRIYNEKLYRNGSLHIDEVGRNSESFLIGTKAEEYYLNLILKNDSKKDWVAFEDIKMKLYNTNTNEIEGSDGNAYSLTHIIAIYFSVLKNMAEEHFTTKGHIYGENEIQWTVTIPAIWDDNAKKTMEKVCKIVFNKYIPKVLEPEAAAVHIAYQKGIEFKSGNKFLVVDIGGGTTDTVGLEIKQDGTGKTYTEECISSKGNNKAGSDIDKAYWVYLAKKLCKGIHDGDCNEDSSPKYLYNELIIKAWKDYPQLKITMRHWWHELKHSIDTISENGTVEITILPDYMTWLYKKHKRIAEKLRSGFYIKPIIVNKKEFLNEIFDPTIEEITNTVVESVNQRSENENFDYVFLVGGSSSIKRLATKIRKEIGCTKLYFADESEQIRFVHGGTILYGAAYMHINGILLRRISTKYYYINYAQTLSKNSIEEMNFLRHYYDLSKNEFDQLLHEEIELFNLHKVNNEYCCDYLHPICYRGKHYKNYEGTAYPIDPKQNSIPIAIWSSDEIALLSGRDQDGNPRSSKIHFEAKVEVDCSVEKTVYLSIDFNKVAENSYFTVLFKHKDGTVFNELKVDRVETIVGH